ncbi:CAMK protein kinase [Saprolegnia parasitica CBS 223.65]|uniref:CAMK protein kinase n=1 Tax=Saprolegnia parasitica (strain CBS 223.65) TaxID=695850 RepID=A0A067C718_SAPPC|nr:CAMK protein kinase [Saprolegnia parasitica CBS 223.65]KDO22336.1 CAMK protein kinase [Saprolegnia parasitica CBS 223.65]|eukprot:XP_012206970.1 CAMK protein kinase [Saprolegnia parasitica CBS 223.65]
MVAALQYARRAVTWLRARVLQTLLTPHLSSHYKLLDGPVLGVGFAGTVVRAIHLASGTEVAIKRLRPPSHGSLADYFCNAHNEVTCLERVAGHAHVVLLLERFATAHTFDMVFPLAPHGNLGHYLRVHGDMPEMAAKSVVQQVLAAVAHCHAQHIVHCDIKLENIFIRHVHPPWQKLVVQLGDFGFATIMDETRLLEGLCGTPLYVAPEMLAGEPYSMAVDLWSVGVVAYILLAHGMPTSPRGFQYQRLPSIAAQAFVQALLQRCCPTTT